MVKAKGCECRQGRRERCRMEISQDPTCARNMYMRPISICEANALEIRHDNHLLDYRANVSKRALTGMAIYALFTKTSDVD